MGIANGQFKPLLLAAFLLFSGAIQSPIFANTGNIENLILAQAIEKPITISSRVAEQWRGGYKLQLNITANEALENWSSSFSLPQGYTIRGNYGIDIELRGETVVLVGRNGWKNLKAGETISPVLIIDSSQAPFEPTFFVGEDAIANNGLTSDLRFVSKIVEQWTGGYKVVIEVIANKDVSDWSTTFSLPSSYTLRQYYGGNITENGGTYQVTGESWNKSLAAGEASEIILIIDTAEVAVNPQLNGFNLAAGETTDVAIATEEGQATGEDKDNDLTVPTTDIGSTGETDLTVRDSSSTNHNVEQNNDPYQPTDITVPDNKPVNTNQKGKYAYGTALQLNFLFWNANRSGKIGADNRLEWRSDSTMSDGHNVNRDLTGGYFDAGDHVKFGQPMAWSITQLAWGGIEYREAYQRSGQFDELLLAIKHGTDYFLKAHETDGSGTVRFWGQCGEGQYAHKKWTSAENIANVTPRNCFAIDRNKPGTDLAAGTAAALASSAMLFRGVDDNYSAELLTNARQLFDFAEKYKAKYSDSIGPANPYYTSWSGYQDELVHGAAWMHKATGEAKYLEKAKGYFSPSMIGDWTYATDDHSYGAMILLAQAGDETAKNHAKRWIGHWLKGDGGINYTPGGFAHRAAWSSVPLAASAAYLAQLYHDTVEPNQAYADFAKTQTDYILGNNPMGFSYMIGFGNKSAVAPHHRGSSPSGGSSPTSPMEHYLWGGVVGGPQSANDFDYEDSRHNWVANEVGTSYNAPVASLLIQMYDRFGGDAMSDSKLSQLRGVK